MTNLLIATSQNRNAVDVSAPARAGGNHYYYNLLGGPRAAQYKTSSTSTASFEYKFNAATTINSLFIGDASEIINSNFSSSATDFDVLIESSSDGVAWTTRASETGINSFIGTTETDYILNFPGVSAQYWRITVTPDANSEFKISKLFLCEAVDLGREPSNIRHLTAKVSKDYSLDGNLLSASYNQLPLQIELSYKNLTDAQVKSFYDSLDVGARGYVTLFNTSNNLQLANMNCIYGLVSEIRSSKAKANNNFLNFRFDEQF